MTRRRKEAPMPGTDSFLDVVANLVGILIILVVVIGASAASNWSAPTDVASSASQELEQNLEHQRKEALNYEQNNREIRAKIGNERSLIALKRRQRHLLLVQAEELKQEFENQSDDFGHKEKGAVKTAS